MKEINKKIVKGWSIRVNKPATRSALVFSMSCDSNVRVTMFRGRVKQLISTWQSSSRARNGIGGWKLCSQPRRPYVIRVDPFERRKQICHRLGQATTPDRASRIIILRHPLQFPESVRRFASRWRCANFRVRELPSKLPVTLLDRKRRWRSG